MMTPIFHARNRRTTPAAPRRKGEPASRIDVPVVFPTDLVELDGIKAVVLKVHPDERLLDLIAGQGLEASPEVWVTRDRRVTEPARG